MESSAEDAILLLKRWKDNSSTLRMVLGTSHARMTLHGTLADVAESGARAHGTSVEEDLQFSFADAIFGFADARGVPPEAKQALGSILDEVLSIVWNVGSKAEDFTRLTIVCEKSTQPATE